MFANRSPEQEEQTSHYYELEITPALHRELIAWCRGDRTRLGYAVRPAFETALLNARRMDLELIRTKLDWSRVSREARRQGVSEADILFDRMGRFG